MTGSTNRDHLLHARHDFGFDSWMYTINEWYVLDIISVISAVTLEVPGVCSVKQQ
jgi:hypothetical protein